MSESGENEKVIMLDENTKPPSMAEIENYVKKQNVRIFDAPVEYLNELIEHFKYWEWYIYRYHSDDTHFTASSYLQNYDTIKGYIRDGRVFEIILYKKSDISYNEAEVILRDEYKEETPYEVKIDRNKTLNEIFDEIPNKGQLTWATDIVQKVIIAGKLGIDLFSLSYAVDRVFDKIMQNNEKIEFGFTGEHLQCDRTELHAPHFWKEKESKYVGTYPYYYCLGKEGVVKLDRLEKIKLHIVVTSKNDISASGYTWYELIEE